jgi:6-phosphogluconolactonase
LFFQRAQKSATFSRHLSQSRQKRAKLETGSHVRGFKIQKFEIGSKNSNHTRASCQKDRITYLFWLFTLSAFTHFSRSFLIYGGFLPALVPQGIIIMSSETLATATTTTAVASLIVADNKAAVSTALTATIVSIAATALAQRGAFIIALSGGSLPSLLWPALQDAFVAQSVDPKYDCWHVLLADERCVPLDHEDNNLKSIRENFLDHCPAIPNSQIHGINEEQLQVSTEAVAKDYDATVKAVLAKSGCGGQLDLAVLGFGPDGHTCSLFPGHALLNVNNSDYYVLPIDDSPKPPPKRITLTLHVLNKLTRHVIVCGAGDSKSPILRAIFERIVLVDDDTDDKCTTSTSSSKRYQATLKDPAPYPCSMVRPDSSKGVENNTLTWVVDSEAMTGVETTSSSTTT